MIRIIIRWVSVIHTKRKRLTKRNEVQERISMRFEYSAWNKLNILLSLVSSKWSRSSCFLLSLLFWVGRYELNDEVAKSDIFSFRLVFCLFRKNAKDVYKFYIWIFIFNFKKSYFLIETMMFSFHFYQITFNVNCKKCVCM